jgi:hypothetical protein
MPEHEVYNHIHNSPSPAPNLSGDEDVSMLVFKVATPYELQDYTRVSE